MSTTLKRHGIECVDLDQNGECVPTLKSSPDALPSCVAMASGCLALGHLIVCHSLELTRRYETLQEEGQSRIPQQKELSADDISEALNSVRSLTCLSRTLDANVISDGSGGIDRPAHGKSGRKSNRRSLMDGHVPARADCLFDRGNRRDSLSPRRGTPHCRYLGLCGTPTEGPAREAAGLRLHYRRHPEDPRSEARSCPHLFRSPSRHRGNAHPPGRRRARLQSAHDPANSRHDPH